MVNDGKSVPDLTIGPEEIKSATRNLALEAPLPFAESLPNLSSSKFGFADAMEDKEVSLPSLERYKLWIRIYGLPSGRALRPPQGAINGQESGMRAPGAEQPASPPTHTLSGGPIGNRRALVYRDEPRESCTNSCPGTGFGYYSLLVESDHFVRITPVMACHVHDVSLSLMKFAAPSGAVIIAIVVTDEGLGL